MRKGTNRRAKRRHERNRFSRKFVYLKKLQRPRLHAGLALVASPAHIRENRPLIIPRPICALSIDEEDGGPFPSRLGSARPSDTRPFLEAR